MATGRRVVIIGIASHWGAELARRLERDPSIDYLAGIDTVPPPVELERTDFIEADIRGPLLSRLLPGTEADTVVHCGILWYPEPDKPARILHDVNVIGTLQLLAACQRTETLERVVVRGSAAIYGCEGPSPSFFTEQMARSSRFAPASSATSPSSRGTSRTSLAGTRISSAACCATSRRSARPRHAPGPLPEPPGGPDPARVRSSPAAPARRRRHGGARGGDPQPGPRGGQRRALGIDLAEPHPPPRPAAIVADPAPAVRPGAGAAGPAARRRPGLRRRRAPASVRARRRQPAPAHRDRLRAQVRRGRRRSRLRRQEPGSPRRALAPPRRAGGQAREGRR